MVCRVRVSTGPSFRAQAITFWQLLPTNIWCPNPRRATVTHFIYSDSYITRRTSTSVTCFVASVITTVETLGAVGTAVVYTFHINQPHFPHGATNNRATVLTTGQLAIANIATPALCLCGVVGAWYLS